MPQDAYTLLRVARELNKKLKGGKISKIIQPSRDELSFIIYTKEGNVKLEACMSASGCRLSLSSADKKSPASAPNFCMLLRKHLQNAEILNIGQVGFERIVKFDFLCVSDFSSENMSLYFEVMGKYSNATLVKDGIIVGALKSTYLGENVKRVLFTGAKYCLPEPQNKIQPDDIAGLELALSGRFSDPAKVIADRVTGIAYTTAEEICAYFGGMPTPKQLKEFVFGCPEQPCVILREGAPNDFKVYSLSPEKKAFGDILAAQDYYYGYVTEKKKFSDKKRKLESAVNAALKKAEKRLAATEAKLFECADAETLKLKGELITANIYALERGMDKFEAVNYYDPNGGKITILLDKSLTPSANAQRYYKKYAKQKRTIESCAAQKAETEEKIEYLKSIGGHIYAAESLYDLIETESELQREGLLPAPPAVKGKQPEEGAFREYEIRGFKVIAGRNNIQNDRLLKSLAPEDIWLHTQKYHSAHVGIITQKREPPEEVIAAAAEICAYYSDGREGKKIPVDYCLRKFVKKPPKSRAGFVIYTDFKTALADPCRHDGEGKNK